MNFWRISFSASDLNGKVGKATYSLTHNVSDTYIVSETSVLPIISGEHRMFPNTLITIDQRSMFILTKQLSSYLGTPFSLILNRL